MQTWWPVAVSVFSALFLLGCGMVWAVGEYDKLQASLTTLKDQTKDLQDKYEKLAATRGLQGPSGPQGPPGPRGAEGPHAPTMTPSLVFKEECERIVRGGLQDPDSPIIPNSLDPKYEDGRYLSFNYDGFVVVNQKRWNFLCKEYEGGPVNFSWTKIE